MFLAFRAEHHFPSMSDVKEIMRTKSQKFLGMLETALHLPVTLDRQVSSEEGRGNALTRAISTRKAIKKEEEEYEAGFNGEEVGCPGQSSQLPGLCCRRSCEHGGQGEVRGPGAAAVLHELWGDVWPTHHTVQEGPSLLHHLQGHQQDLQGVQADHGGLPQHCSPQIIILNCLALQVWVSFLFSMPGHSSAVPGLVAAQNYNSSTRSVNMRHCVA